MKTKLLSSVLALLALATVCRAAGPTVSNVRASQRAGTQLVDVYYDVSSASNALTVSVTVSTNGGASYFTPGTSASGALGTGIAPGSNRKITWNAGTDLPAKLFSNVRVSVTADDAVPSGMALIPAGSFTMGDNFGDGAAGGWPYETPLHSVYVSAFYMDKYEVTKALWDEVVVWNGGNGYAYETGSGLGKAANHPVQTVSWYDVVKWCNARSQKEGKTPCYYTDAGLTTIYKTGQVAPYVNWSANGYRLPTEAEWEKAARGGSSGHRFPWSDSDTIQHSRANYYSSTSYTYDTSSTRGYHPTFATNSAPYTSPAGYFAPNGYGLYDMAGNVWEWCWDWWDGGWYSNAGATQNNTPGPASGSDRVLRGGSSSNYAVNCRVAFRDFYYPTYRNYYLGFRCARAAGQ